MDRSTLVKFSPSRFLNFTIPHPSDSARLLRFSILDSPHHSDVTTSPFQIAALIVPKGRESDWIFSTASGHLQLFLSSPIPISRLFLVAEVPIGFPDHPSPVSFNVTFDPSAELVEFLKPLFLYLSPKGTGDVSFVNYDDNVVSSQLVERSCGGFAGEMLVEDVEILVECEGKRSSEFRRRLRFKRMPNLVQTEMALVPIDEGRTRFQIDQMNLAYLASMVAATSLIGSWVDSQSTPPKALCLGVGGGALLAFLKLKLGFDVLGVEIDEEVIRIAKKHFGLGEFEAEIVIGEAMEFVRRFPARDSRKFELIMVDLDSREAEGGCAPPAEFAGKEFLSLARAIVSDSGIVAVNAIPVRGSFYEDLVGEFRTVFDEVYEIDGENSESLVLVGRIRSAESSDANGFNCYLREAISGRFMDSIRRL